ncbi:MAG: SCO family protein [Motilibacteraceae bacterium]
MANLPLTDQSGRQITLASLHGKTVVLVDFLTLCQEICPLTSATLAQADRAVQAAGNTDKVVFLEATVDPARDTVPRLAAYAKLWPGHPNWLFATGSAKNLAALWSYFGVSYDKVSEDEDGPAPKDWLTGAPLTYDVQHQDVVWIIGPDGHRRWEQSGNPDARGQQLPGTLKTFLSQDGRTNQASPGPQAWSAADITSAISWVTGKALPHP